MTKQPDMQLNLIEYSIDNTAKRDCIDITHNQAQKLIAFMGDTKYERGNFGMWLTASVNKEESLKEESKFNPQK